MEISRMPGWLSGIKLVLPWQLSTGNITHKHTHTYKKKHTQTQTHTCMYVRRASVIAPGVVDSREVFPPGPPPPPLPIAHWLPGEWVNDLELPAEEALTDVADLAIAIPLKSGSAADPGVEAEAAA